MRQNVTNFDHSAPKSMNLPEGCIFCFFLLSLLFLWFLFAKLSLPELGWQVGYFCPIKFYKIWIIVAWNGQKPRGMDCQLGALGRRQTQEVQIRNMLQVPWQAQHGKWSRAPLPDCDSKTIINRDAEQPNGYNQSIYALKIANWCRAGKPRPPQKKGLVHGTGTGMRQRCCGWNSQFHWVIGIEG